MSCASALKLAVEPPDKNSEISSMHWKIFSRQYLHHSQKYHLKLIISVSLRESLIRINEGPDN